MKTVFRWIRIVSGVLVGLIVLVVGAVYGITEARINRTYDIRIESVPVPTDADAIAYGQRLVKTRGCVDCHGENLAGRVIQENPIAGRLVATNLTAGRNGIAKSYTVAEPLSAFMPKAMSPSMSWTPTQAGACGPPACGYRARSSPIAIGCASRRM